MTPSTGSATGRKLGSLALGLLIGVGSLHQPSAAAAVAGKKACTPLERRLDGRLRRGLKSCGKGAGTFAALRCASGKRTQHLAALAVRGCHAPVWAVEVETIKLNAETVALVWTGRLNWARLLDRRDDPIASSARLPGDLFENLLLLERAGDIATVVDYVEDVEARATDVVNGLPGELTGGSGARGAFPSIGDRSAIEAVDTFLQLIQACNEGAPSMFADHQFGGASERTQKEFSGDPGATATDLAYIVRDIIKAIFGDPPPPPPPPSDPPPSDPPSDPPPADEDQCTEENEDGSCNEGGENPDDQQSQEGGDDPEEKPTTSTTLPPPPPAGQNPTGDPGTDGGGCAPTLEAITALCESMDWQTSTCRAIVQAANGCADESLINPGPEGEVPCSGEGMSEAEYRAIECEQQGKIAQPGPDGELVCVSQDLRQQAPPDLVGFDPCNSPESQGTAEMCSERGGVGPEPDPLPPLPGPDPRGRSLR